MKKEIIQIPGNVDCIIDVHLQPIYEIEGKPASTNDCRGKKIKHTEKPTFVTLIVPTYTKHGNQKGRELQHFTVDQITSIYNKINEIVNRKPTLQTLSEDDDLPF